MNQTKLSLCLKFSIVIGVVKFRIDMKGISKESSTTVIELPEDEDIEEIDLVDIDLTE